MGLNDLPSIVKKHIVSSVNREKEGYYTVKDNEIHVTELLYCIRKSYFKRTIPKSILLKGAYNMWRGQELDEAWTPLFPDNQQRCTYRIQGIPVTIVGKYDFIDPEDGAIGDLKTVKNLYYCISAPKMEHVKQIRFYAYLNAISKAKLIYMDYGDCVKHDVSVTDSECLEVIRNLEITARVLYQALVNKTPPEVYPSEERKWLCGEGEEWECEYFRECKQREPIKQEKKRKK